MKLVQRANRQLRIEDARLPEMLAKGYVEVKTATEKSAAVSSAKPRRKERKP